MQAVSKSILKKALVKSMPIFFSYVFVAFSYGLLMAEAGFAWHTSLFVSLTVYTGAFQFVLITFLSSGAGILTVAITALLLNSRQSFYSLTQLSDFRAYSGWKRLYMIHTMTDETYAVNVATKKEEPDRQEVLFFVALFSRCYWMLGAILGGILGQVIPVTLDGIEFCMTALFLIIFINQWEKAQMRGPALVGLGIGILCLLLFGTSTFMLPALLLTSSILLLCPERNMDQKEADYER